MTETSTDIGSVLSISEEVPEQKDQTGYDGITNWEKVKGLVSIGAVGNSTSTVEIPDLESGRTIIKKGTVQGTDTAITVRKIPGDPGQQKMIEAAKPTNLSEYSIRIEEPDGTIEYASGVIHSRQRRAREGGSYAGFDFTFVPNNESVFTDPE